MSHDAERKGQSQERQPGKEYKMYPLPEFIKKGYKGSGILKDKVAVITGGDSGIGRAIAVLFAEEGADLVIAYLGEDQDAGYTKEEIEKRGRKAVLINGDVSDSSHCKTIVAKTIEEFGKIDILINNAAMQFPQESLTDISDEQLHKTFETNIYPYFYLSREALPHMDKGCTIINTSSVTAYQGNGRLIDYSATKGAIVSFTRSLSANLAHKGIRVNGVAPGPIWTPLIPATFGKEDVATFGQNVPLNRAGEPSEVAPCFLFLASDLSSYISGQFLHPNGGEIINT
ncbi:NAD(P)-dependent dehydrogenase (short-subunit alcohol dehydrogenase family) [Algoriphagus sp. 4150]|uniref:SDR family oxidoreductase n=1 Tax=Algoriphagus sp. 4150 TaxID=2817756 RepID=UPI00285B368F|nr:SDR family oxidoreductase [Algoriphagus sp. 4150]MDR7127847.1 NAD(P)-dependent dehydrogenase (short-subunit alcohol dehydrogenase family) [Algoriphagus sp. 4150]